MCFIHELILLMSTNSNISDSAVLKISSIVINT